MKKKVMMMLLLAAVATCVIATPVQASRQGRNNTAIGVGALCLGALLSNAFREPETRYVERQTVVVPQRTVVYQEPVQTVRYTRVRQPATVVYQSAPVQYAPVQYERVIDYYQY